jgi:hypothetical protein
MAGTERPAEAPGTGFKKRALPQSLQRMLGIAPKINVQIAV